MPFLFRRPLRPNLLYILNLGALCCRDTRRDREQDEEGEQENERGAVRRLRRLRHSGEQTLAAAHLHAGTTSRIRHRFLSRWWAPILTFRALSLTTGINPGRYREEGGITGQGYQGEGAAQQGANQAGRV